MFKLNKRLGVLVATATLSLSGAAYAQMAPEAPPGPSTDEPAPAPTAPAPEKAVPAPNIDTNGDGKADAWDKDGDGKADAWDKDGDGKPDAKKPKS